MFKVDIKNMTDKWNEKAWFKAWILKKVKTKNFITRPIQLTQLKFKTFLPCQFIDHGGLILQWVVIIAYYSLFK